MKKMISLIIAIFVFMISSACADGYKVPRFSSTGEITEEMVSSAEDFIKNHLDMSVLLERVYIHIHGEEKLIELEAWLDGLASQLGYRPRWSLIDMTAQKVYVDLFETILEVDYQEENNQILVPDCILSDMLVKENELISQYPDGQKFEISALETIEHDFLKLNYYLDLSNQGVRVNLVFKNSNTLSETLLINDYQFIQGGDFEIPAEIYRQLYYRLMV